MKKSEYLISELRGAPVYTVGKKTKRIGKVHSFIFHPHKRRVVGFTVKRPDIALMMHRPIFLLLLMASTFKKEPLLSMNLREHWFGCMQASRGFLERMRYLARSPFDE